MESEKSTKALQQSVDDSSTVELEASVRLERRQLEMLLMHALKISGGDFSYIVSAAGQGAYAEQFVQLDAAAVRSPAGEFSAHDESLSSRRADPSTQSVMRNKKIVHGSVLTHGLPLHFIGHRNSLTHFVQIPIENGSARTCVLFVANPGISTSGKLQGDILNRLVEVAGVISKRQQRSQALNRKADLASSSDESSFHLRRLKEELEAAVVTVNTTGVIRGINPAAEKLFGTDVGHALGMTFDRYLPPKYFISTLQQVESWNSDLGEDKMHALKQRNVSIIAENGRTKELSAAAYYLQDNRERCVSFVFSEPTGELSCADKTNGLNFRANSMSLGVIRLDADFECEHVNELWCQISGQSSFEAKGFGWSEAIHSEDLMDLWVELGAIACTNRPYSGKVRLHRLDGTVRQVALAASYVPDESGCANGFIIVFQDLTVDYLARQQISYVTGHDALTGLVNRSSFLDSLQIRLNNRHLRNKTALLYIDVKGIKAINASAGQHAGDEIIRQVSQRLDELVDRNDLTARLSGSEFSILLMQTIDPIEVCSTAVRIVHCVNEPFLVFGDTLRLSATVGISIGDCDSNSSDQMLKQADVALGAAIESELCDWQVYTRTLENKGVEQLLLNERILAAVNDQEFTLDYQPQYSLEKDEIVSFEALLHWLPLDMPAPTNEELIKALEKIDLITEVGHWVLETACRQFMTWENIGLLAKSCTMSVNIVPAQLMNVDFPKQITSVLNSCAMPPSRLNLEITESDLDEHDVIAYPVVDELKQMGVRLSLSEFGTGKSSLSHLNRLPIHSLKIDRSFILAMDNHAPSRSMVMSMLAIASTLDIDVVADGIENRATLGELKAAQCKVVQGDLISKAKSASFLEPMLVRRNYKYEDMLQLS